MQHGHQLRNASRSRATQAAARLLFAGSRPAAACAYASALATFKLFAMRRISVAAALQCAAAAAATAATAAADTPAIRRPATMGTTALALEDGAAAFPADFWTAAPMTDRNLNANMTAHWLVPVDALRASGDTDLLGWAPPSPTATAVYPLTDTMSTVRLLGGWAATSSVPLGCCQGCSLFPKCTPPHCCQVGPRRPGAERMQCCNPVAWSDVAWRRGGGASTSNSSGAEVDLAFRWPALFDRLDGVVNNSIRPVVVLDNVDYAFVRNTSSIGKYGQNLGPVNVTEFADGFIAPLVEQLVARYGRDRVASEFWFRVGTEPNTVPGHWDDTVEKYIDEYVAVERAVKRVLGPAASVGPGNFCPFYQPGKGCNRTSGGLDTYVAPIVAAVAARSSLSFLGESFYGSAGACGQGHGPHGAVGPCGYDPSEASLAAEGLRYLRDTVAGARYAGVPLQFMEYGTLGNRFGRVSPEPGAFGGAWTLATSAVAASGGVCRAFHWANHDAILNGTRRLYYSNAWLSSMLIRLFGPSPPPGAIRVLTPTTNGGATRDARGYAPTAAFGVGGPARVDGASRGVGVLLSVFSADKNRSDETVATVRFACQAKDEGGGGDSGCAAGVPPTVTTRVLNKSTSTYDVLRAGAAAKGWLAYPGDGEVYSVPMMLNAGGLAALQTPSAASTYLAAQEKLFAPVADVGGVSVSCDVGGECTLRVSAAPPSVFAVTVSWPGAGAPQ